MKKLLSILVLIFGYATAEAQVSTPNTEQFPVFPSCQNLMYKELENCFNNQVQDFVYHHFQVPDDLKQNNYKGSIIVLFEVDEKGVFKTLYVDTNENKLS